tara:strand:- start:841 stop:1035 length:195 start_codon:yes stop_codon:yes gene_type:complete
MRYALAVENDLYLAACYEATGSGIMLTTVMEDACSYVTIEKAINVAIQVRHSLGHVPSVIEVEN